MHSNDEDAARRTRTLVSREIDGPGGVRDFAMRANLSEATIRKIASTGIVSSHVVAAAIAFRPVLESNPVANAVYQWRWPLVVLWFTGLLLLILVRFWDYWSTLI